MVLCWYRVYVGLKPSQSYERCFAAVARSGVIDHRVLRCFWSHYSHGAVDQNAFDLIKIFAAVPFDEFYWFVGVVE